MYGWAAGAALAMLLGLIVGSNIGAKSERETIAAECKATGSFTLRRTGFKCEKIDIAKK